MQLNDLKNTVKRPSRKRVGRGDSSGNGRTAGRGEKGAGSRTGHSRRPYFEGGQIPLIRRLPKRGFNMPDHIVYNVVNLSTLEDNFEAGATVGKEELIIRGFLGKCNAPLKVLANGEITKALTVKADKFSATAKAKIEAAGGTCVEA